MRAHAVTLLAVLAATLMGGCPESPPVAPPTPGGMLLTSPAFPPGAPIPARYTGDGEDISPPLQWTGVPDGTRELALICDDPDAPSRSPWVHWVLYGISPDLGSLEEGGSGGALEGLNGFGQARYGGPAPPHGHGVHHYHFRLLALDTPLVLAAGATREQVEAAMEGHILATAELVGTYQR